LKLSPVWNIATSGHDIPGVQVFLDRVVADLGVLSECSELNLGHVLPRLRGTLPGPYLHTPSDQQRGVRLRLLVQRRREGCIRFPITVRQWSNPSSERRST